MGKTLTGISFDIVWDSWALPLAIRACKYTDQFEITNYSGTTEDMAEDYFYLTIQVLCFELTYTKLLREYELPPMHSNCRCVYNAVREGE